MIVPAGLIVFGLLVAGIQNPTAPDKPRLTLHASSAEPYVGQVVQLTLEIELSATKGDELPRLSIPWLNREFGFTWQLAAEEWLCRQTGTRDGLAVRINNWPRPIPALANRRNGMTQYQLSWSFVVQEPDDVTQGRIEFAPIRLETAQGALQTKPLRLSVRKLPLPPANLPGLNMNLGVGNYRLEASLAPARVTLGESAILTLKVSGSGALTRLPRPVLTSLPPFRQPDAWLVEDGTEAWDDEKKSRYFRYVLQPRRLGTASIPPLFYTCFDPTIGKYQTRATVELTLIVNPSAAKTIAAVQRYEPGTVPDRLRLASTDAASAQPSLQMTAWQSAAFLAIMPAALAVLLYWREHRRRRLGRHEHLWRSLAGRRALHRLRELNDDELAANAVSIFEDFLRQRFYISASSNGDANFSSFLQHTGVRLDQMELAQDFQRRCDAARFGPPTDHDDEGLRHLAERLITEFDAS
jgi:hypothetical protein